MTDVVEKQEWEKNPDNKVISPDEISKIEAITAALKTPEAEQQTQKKLDQVDNDFLDDIKKQANLILNGHVDQDGPSINNDETKAICSLLRIHQLQKPGSIQGEIKLDGTGGVDAILAIVGTKPENFKAVLGEKGVSILQKFVDAKRNEEETAYNQETEKYKDENNLEVEGGDVPPERARVYIENLLNDPEITGTVSEKFNKIREKFNENTAFPKAIDSLMNYCVTLGDEEHPSPFLGLEGDLNLKNMTSKKVRQFQSMASNDPQLAAILSKDFKNGGNGVDGKLGANTIGAILEITKALERRFEGQKNEKTIQSVESREVDKGGRMEMPTTFAKLKKYGDLGEDNKFVFFDGTNNAEKKDFVQSLTGNENAKFVNIDGKKYFIEGGNDNDYKFMQTQEAYKGYDKDGNEITLYKQNLSFGKFDKNGKLLEGTTITIDADGKQLQATTFDQLRTRYEGNPPKEVEGQMAAIRLGNKIDDEGNFKGKWRIDLFTDDDAKRLNKDQLKSLDAQDITFTIDQAIAAYDETKHKPSEVGRYNLNRIVYSTMHRTGGFDKLDAPFDTPKTVSHIILGMDTGFFTNPDKELTQDNLNGVDDAKLMKMLGVNKNDVKDYKELKYDGTEKKGEQIINRLRILKAYVDKNKGKLENKKN